MLLLFNFYYRMVFSIKWTYLFIILLAFVFLYIYTTDAYKMVWLKYINTNYRILNEIITNMYIYLKLNSYYILY